MNKYVCEIRSDEGIRFFKDDVCGTLRTIDACGSKCVIETENEMVGEGKNRMIDIKKGNTALIQPVDRDYKKHGTKRTEHLEFKDDGVSHSLRAQIQTYCVDNETRIRKLTPKECWRLMGFDDSDFEKAEKVNSNSQLYKQAGNSIVVDVLEELFCMLLDDQGEFYV